jgi:predicted Zn-dependent peptidase
MTSIVTRQLSCGMPLLLEPMEGVRSAAISWAIPAGAAVDAEDRQGASTMYGELLLRGAGQMDSRAHADALDRVGAGRSADVGTYFVRIGATLVGDRFPAVLPLLVDMALRPRMDAESIEPARDMALQAIESLADDPQERAMIAARARHQRSPINRSGLGTPEGLKALSRDELVQGWAAAARPSGSVMAIAGAIDPDRAGDAVEGMLSGWSGRAPQVQLGPAAPRGYAHEADQSNQVQVIVLHDAPAEDDPRCLLERIVTSVLSGGMSGRLFTEVREKRGLCYSVSAGYATDRVLSGTVGGGYGRVLAYVGTTPERAQESLDVLHAELERINTPAGRITPDEFRRAVVGMKSRLVFSGESTSARAGSLVGDFHRLGRARSLDEMASAIDRVTLDQVNAYLAGRSLGRLTVQTLGPAPLRPPAGGV